MGQPKFEGPGAVNPGAEPDRRASPLEVVAVLALVTGLLGYGTYQEIIEPILQANSEAAPAPSPNKIPPTPIATPTLPSLPAPLPLATPTGSPLAPAPAVGAAEIYQRAPRNGVYYAQNPQLNTSRREIVSSNGRFCIKLVNGAVAPQTGQPQILVSSLSLQQDGLYVDATGEKLQFDRSYTEMTDSRGTWLWLEGKGDRTGASAECLAASGQFVREEPN